MVPLKSSIAVGDDLLSAITSEGAAAVTSADEPHLPVAARHDPRRS